VRSEGDDFSLLLSVDVCCGGDVCFFFVCINTLFLFLIFECFLETERKVNYIT
jgi:hypothetical protein